MGNRRITTDPQFPGVYAARDSRKRKAVFAVIHGDYTPCGCGLNGCTYPPDIAWFPTQRAAADFAAGATARTLDYSDLLMWCSLPARATLI